ncbi:hypothetical protein FPOAC1_012643 [Fusarium poae]|uniref:hypothetical protein n=1 Tax=Fusarium poae TaxID=36050 RepID=UPI001CEBD03A|nr:hypothetical protein FPOAC1_012643 [Fusarium poae]KAG8667804.1 hypothetical protein FPOAC1_012643 [Fusarium poae]
MFQEDLSTKVLEDDGPLVLALLVYLQKLYFIYRVPPPGFIKFNELEKSLGREKWIKDNFPEENHIGVFIKAFEEAFATLNPVLLRFEPGHFQEFSTNSRFPFYNEEIIRPAKKGFGSLTKFEIVAEYQDSISRQFHSGEDLDSDKKLVFARKSIPSEDSALANEIEILYRAAKLKSDNLITLLACYKWNKEIHLVFHYIERTLQHILHGERPALSLQVSDMNPLPDNWLWKEMFGVSKALASLHDGIDITIDRKRKKARIAHCDLKPDNILVDKTKLKIIDFGHCFISFARDGGDRIPRITQGHPVYAPPETHPDWNEQEGRHDHIIGVLNYDVWSLACIMVEVLIYVCDIQYSMTEFEEAIRKSHFTKRFFNDSWSIKDCVKETLDKIQDRFTGNDAHRTYITNVGILLNQMFNGNPRERLSSSEVVKSLERIDSEFLKTHDIDEVGRRINKFEPKPEGDFIELAWKVDRRSAIGFTTMDKVKVRAFYLSTPPDESKPCRIRVFRKNDEKRPLLIAYAQSHNSKVKLIDFRPPDWCFQPTYLSQNDTIDCLIFKAPSSENSHNSMPIAYEFTFGSLADVCSFQGVLINKKIMHMDKFSQRMEASFVFARRHGEDLNVQNSIVQFWAEGYDVVVQSAVASNFEKAQKLQKPWLTIDTMAIFTKEQLIEVPMYDGRKRFRTIGLNQIEAKVNKGHKHFFSYWYRVISPFDPDGEKYKISSIQPGQSQILFDRRETGRNKSNENRGCLKMTSMEITTREEYEEQLMLAVAKEWETGSGGYYFNEKTGKVVPMRSSTV